MNEVKSTMALVFAAMLAGACGEAETVSVPSGMTEPIRVIGARFVEGPIPEGNEGPRVLTIDSRNNGVRAGQTGKRLSGDVGPGAYAIAIRFADIGKGHYVFPVGPPSQETRGALTWEAIYEVSRNVTPGEQRLHLAAVDGEGRYGPGSEISLLVQSARPEEKVVVSLAWDTDADLDLHIVSPSGKVLGPKQVNTGRIEDGGLPAPGSGQLDRDSNAACVIDGYRRENVVWEDEPEPGTYLIRVNMFHACGQPVANFVLNVWIDGELRIERAGKLLEAQAGHGPGLFVTELSL